MIELLMIHNVPQPIEKIQMSAAKDKENFKDVLILSCEEDRAVCLPFLEQGTSIPFIYPSWLVT